MLLKRFISGVFIAAGIIAAEWISPFFWFLTVCFISITSNYELQKIIEEKKYRHSFKLITIFIILFLSVTYTYSTILESNPNVMDNIKILLNPDNSNVDPIYWKKNISFSIVSIQNLLLGVAFLLVIIVNLDYKPRVSIGELSFAFTRILYLGFFPSYLILLRMIPKGEQFLLMILIAGSMTDIFAYFTGKKFGKTPFFSQISPNKTWEGAIGGVFGCILVCIVGGQLIGVGVFNSIVIGLMTAIIAIMGDLIESLFKRDVGKKDSGNIIPGHGGIMDRVDSYIFIAFPAYFYILYAIY